AGVKGLGTLSRYTPSASVTAPIRIFSQSSSVCGAVSTVPFLVTTILTESKMLSAMGSSMSRISSFTETTGLNVPQSSGTAERAGVAVDVEQANVNEASNSQPAQVTRPERLRSPDI